nr:MAG TPA: hypothetical protein [Caudoviricetes sp.]
MCYQSFNHPLSLQTVQTSERFAPLDTLTL